MTVDLRLRRLGDVVVVELTGGLDSGTAPAVRDRLTAVVPVGGAVVLDLAGLSYLASAGLRLLLLLHREAVERGSRLVLVAPPTGPLAVLEVAGFLTFLDVAGSVPAALAGLDRAAPPTLLQEETP